RQAGDVKHLVGPCDLGTPILVPLFEAGGRVPGIAWTAIIVADSDEEKVKGVRDFWVGQPGLTLL
ncbi:MAG: hypothetical protein ACR2QF_05545, partial [Geminicoccaceae bacterium]